MSLRELELTSEIETNQDECKPAIDLVSPVIITIDMVSFPCENEGGTFSGHTA